MKSLLLSLCVMFMLVQASPLFARGAQDFTLHNETGKEVYEVYLSPASVDNWEEDVLGEDTLEDGSSVDITFDRSESAQLWDMKIVFSDGAESVWSRLKLTELTDLTISYKGGKPYASWKNGE